MKIHKFENIYPRIFWIVDCSNGEFATLLRKFKFYVNTPGWEIQYSDIESELVDAANTAIAGCYVVEERSTGLLGTMMVIFDITSMDTAIIAHESVHVADYYYQATGMNSEEFTDGNEAYAYLVGWAAGCVSNVLIKENKDGKTNS